MQPSFVTFVGVLKACADMITIEEGTSVHQQIIQSGLEFDIFVGSSLVHMYAKCESMEDAWIIFNKMSHQNVVTWTTMILGHVKCVQGQ
jgi:pentatricopeptide repeat domain-containing protein 1